MCDNQDVSSYIILFANRIFHPGAMKRSDPFDHAISSSDQILWTFTSFTPVYLNHHNKHIHGDKYQLGFCFRGSAKHTDVSRKVEMFERTFTQMSHPPLPLLRPFSFRILMTSCFQRPTRRRKKVFFFFIMTSVSNQSGCTCHNFSRLTLHPVRQFGIIMGPKNQNRRREFLPS